MNSASRSQRGSVPRRIWEVMLSIFVLWMAGCGSGNGNTSVTLSPGGAQALDQGQSLQQHLDCELRRNFQYLQQSGCHYRPGHLAFTGYCRG